MGDASVPGEAVQAQAAGQEAGGSVLASSWQKREPPVHAEFSRVPLGSPV